jgi:benzoyl-CoA reductase subunit C
MNLFVHTVENQSLDEILLACRELAEDPDFPTVRAWRARGGKVAGHFQVYFPEEIAHAAGLLPVKISGAQVEGMEAESHFGSYLCSIIKTSLELALTKKIELDLFISHPICDAARNLAAIWGRNFEYPCEILYLPQNPNSADSIRYLHDEYLRLSHQLERVAGRTIGPDALSHSIRIYNESRRWMRQLYEIKRDSPWLISAEDAYALVAVAGLLPREEYNELMRRVLPLIQRSSGHKQDKMRIVFEGAFCEQPPLDLVQVIGQSCYIVDDDFFIGLRYITEDIDPEGDALWNLAEAYVDKSSYSPVQHDLRKPKEHMLLRRIREAHAEAAILAAAKMCEPGLEEQVAYTRALDEAGIPYFVTEFEENQTTFDHIGIQMETFIENLIFQ